MVWCDRSSRDNSGTRGISQPLLPSFAEPAHALSSGSRLFRITIAQFAALRNTFSLDTPLEQIDLPSTNYATGRLKRERERGRELEHFILQGL